MIPVKTIHMMRTVTELERWKTMNRYDSKCEVPIFALGKAFRCSRKFKRPL
jgi:hypothetical protein